MFQQLTLELAAFSFTNHFYPVYPCFLLFFLHFSCIFFLFRLFHDEIQGEALLTLFQMKFLLRSSQNQLLDLNRLSLLLNHLQNPVIYLLMPLFLQSKALSPFIVSVTFVFPVIWQFHFPFFKIPGQLLISLQFYHLCFNFPPFY